MSDPIRPTHEEHPEGWGEPGEAGGAAWGETDPVDPIVRLLDARIARAYAAIGRGVRAGWRWLTHRASR